MAGGGDVAGAGGPAEGDAPALPTLVTERLSLRPWRAEDRAPVAAMNADPEVMACLGEPLSREASDALVDRIEAHFARRGFGFWAVEVVGGAPFIGMIGLAVPRFEAHFTPCVEIGWRLAREHQRRGYATEGARAALAYGFETLGLEEIVAWTARDNVRSRALMERLGMGYDPADDFAHPMLPEGHPLQEHVLYRLRREAFAAVASRIQAAMPGRIFS